MIQKMTQQLCYIHQLGDFTNQYLNQIVNDIKDDDDVYSLH